MPDPTARELKLIQYLNEAYGKEKQLETTLQAQIKLFAPKPTIVKRLQEHHKETKAQSRGLEKRIKALGGKATTQDLPGPDITDNAAGVVANVANKALAAAKGPVQALRGTSGSDNLLRNARDAYWNEAEEIAHYNVIEAAADQLGDKETVKMAREFRRQEERMQKFIEKQTPGLMKDVIKEEVPKDQRQPASSRSASSRSTSRSTSSRSSSSRSSGTRSSGTKRSTASKSSGTKRSTASKSSGTKSTRSNAKSSGSSNGRSSASSSRSRSSSAKKS